VPTSQKATGIAGPPSETQEEGPVSPFRTKWAEMPVFQTFLNVACLQNIVLIITLFSSN